MSKLTEEEVEQLFGEIENQGFGYWVEHYGYKEDKDPKLKKLCKKARKHLKVLDKYIQELFEEHKIG